MQHTRPRKLEKEYGLPLGYADILMRQLNKEDAILPYDKRIVLLKGAAYGPPAEAPLPKVDMRTWSDAALHVFSRQAFKRTLSIMMP